jgi:hypothetical protein
MLIEALRGFSEYLQLSAGIIPQIGSLLLLFVYLTMLSVAQTI